MSTISASTTSTTAYKVTADTTGTLVLQTGSTPTTAVTIDTAQNMGLGVTPSAWASTFKVLQFKNGIYFGQYDGGGIPSGYFGTNNYFNGSNFIYVASAQATRYQQEQGQHQFYTAASGTAGNAITFTQAMTLDASGNLNVGNTGINSNFRLNLTSPSGNGGVIFVPASDGSAVPVLRMLNAALSTNVAEIGTASGTALYFSTGGTERARIDSSGNLMVGTTSAINTAVVTFQSSLASNVGFIRNTNASPFGIRVNYSAATPNGTDNWFYYADDATASRFIVRSNGGIANYSANNVNLSDSREKTNASPAGDYLAKICAIPVRTYNYIDQNLEEDDGLTLGVFAQDVQAVAPELVMESNWANKDEEPKMRLSIYQTDLQYALMKCIQEQQAIIETLTNRITALEAK